MNPNDLIIQPLDIAETLPSNWYSDPEIAKLEKDKIFSNEWLLIGSASQLKKPGDTLNVSTIENHIIIVKQTDNELKAFYNICRHRAGRLVREKSCLKKIQCSYHGWIYNLDGTLKSAREFDGTKNFDFNDHNLVSIYLKMWKGLIFINFSKNPSPIRKFLDAIDKRIHSTDFSRYVYHGRVSYNIKSNWKVYMDNFLEGYHIPFVHPGLNKLVNYKSYKTELFDNFSLQWCPIDNEKSPYGNAKNNHSFAYYFTIFPNILLNITPGRLQTNIIEPTSPNTCVVHFDYYFENSNISIDSDLEFSESVQQEDILICEEVQLGLESNAYNTGRFSVKSEAGVHHFQSLFKKRISDG